MYLPQFLLSRADRPPLRIGLLLDSFQLPLWIAEIIEQIQATNYARVELVVLPEPPPRPHLLTRLLRTAVEPRRRSRLLFNLYSWLDSKLAARRSAYPFRPVDGRELLSGVPVLRVQPQTKGFIQRFPEEALERLRAADLDVLLRFGFKILKGDVLRAAKYGVWSYHHGDNDFYRGGPPYFWELYEHNPVSGAVLQVLTEELDAGLVLCKGQFTTVGGVSHAANQERPYWGAQNFVIHKLWKLHSFGWEYVRNRAVPSAPYRGKRTLYTAPTNLEMLRWLGRVVLPRLLRRTILPRTVPHWRLAWRERGPMIADGQLEPGSFRWLEAPPGRFYADLFLIEHRGQPWVFFEDMDYAANRARISAAPVVPGQGIGAVVPVLERPFHLSYPYVFQDGGQLYMVPESVEAGRVELYRCEEFPGSWTLEKVLLSQPAVDTSVWIEDGVYWFWVTLQERRGYATRLWLFWADSLTGEWHSHPQNPISSDMRNCRGAGALFRRNGVLYRPSQDCCHGYGYSFTLNRVLKLTKTEYQEEPGVTVLPDWSPGLIGTHTYSILGAIEMIDGCQRLARDQVSGARRSVGFARGILKAGLHALRPRS